MTHIELSLSPLDPSPHATGQTDPLEQWAATVAMAEEACLVIDAEGIIIAASPSCALLFCHQKPFELTGRHLLDPAVLSLIDFTAAGADLGGSERGQIPPLLALSSGRLARGLMRLRHQKDTRTLDAVASPLRHGGEVSGSLSFFAEV
ncbi:transcriptional regulator [Catelliglobosispora koreensis]|uniref:hypothetical protein n=1 Tax=Catelliglobosispora koreensis TaxID=129052 RepID=UPI000477BFE1|nr:hypothetical protein [Catelliglobosispora koreensis]